MKVFFVMRFRFATFVLSGLIAFVFMFAGTGCHDEKSSKVVKLSVLRGGEQCAPAGAKFIAPVIIEVKGADGHIANAKLKLQVAPESDLKVCEAVVSSDIGGMVVFYVTAGKKIGDQYLSVIPESNPDAAIKLRFVSGLEFQDNNREGITGEVLKEPVSIKVTSSDGKPLVGVPVSFSLQATAEGSKSTAAILNPHTFTDENGIAQTNVKLGQKTGAYRFNINVDDEKNGCVIRNYEANVMGINPSGVIITVLGGLAVFIYGMGRMSEGLKRVAGENMRKILQFFTSNRVVALFAGAAVTAVLQSSSATSVMAIGFINAGLLTLKQALGIIFGASIGTTVTAQIISFNLSALTLPAIVIGVVMSFSSSRVVKGWGAAVLGFGMLFLGLNMMSSELKVMGEMPTLRAAFEIFDCAPRSVGGFMPLGAVMGSIVIGIVVTMIIQASGAFAGIVLALASGGLVNFYTAIAMLLGANIGTTITAILAAIPGNRVAKQAAVAHTLFKCAGALLMILLFYVPWGENRIPILLALTDAITPGNAFAAMPQNLERHIAMAYTICNVSCAVIMLPALEFFVKLGNWLLPIRQEAERKTTILEPVLLQTPSIALKQTTSAIKVMVVDAWGMVAEAINTHFINRDSSAEKISSLEQQEQSIDRMQKEITDYLVKLTRQHLTEPQSELIPLLMHCTNDAERIGDYCETILELSGRLNSESNPLSQNAIEELQKMWKVLNDQAQNVIMGLSEGDLIFVSNALADEKEINMLADAFESEHIERLRQGKCTAKTGVIYIEMLGEISKISARLTNISERTVQIQKHYVKL